MKKHPSIPLLVLAVAILGLGFLVSHNAAPRPLMPAVLQLRSYLVVAGLVVVAAVVVGLRRQPAREFSRYDWPGRVSTRTAVKMFVGAAAVLVIGLLISSQGPTCGSVTMHPGDRCTSGGSTASYSDVAAAPIRQPWIYVLIALALIGYAVAQLFRRRPPTPQEINTFEATVVTKRRQLINNHNRLVGLQCVTPEALPARLAQFDQDVQKERERAGFDAN